MESSLFRAIDKFNWLDAQDGKNKIERLKEYKSQMQGFSNAFIAVYKSLATLESFKELPLADQINCAAHCVLKGSQFYNGCRTEPLFAEYLYAEKKQFVATLDCVAQIIACAKESQIDATMFDAYVQFVGI